MILWMMKGFKTEKAMNKLCGKCSSSINSTSINVGRYQIMESISFLRNVEQFRDPCGPHPLLDVVVTGLPFALNFILKNLHPKYLCINVSILETYTLKYLPYLKYGLKIPPMIQQGK